MGPGASIEHLPLQWRPRQRGIVWPSVIAILFATVAAISFAVDQSVDISTFAALMLDD